jgi:hypothetical protein
MPPLSKAVPRTPQPQRITDEERLRRQKAVTRAHAHNYIEGIDQDPAATPIFAAFTNGEIDLVELGRRIDALVASR